MKNLWKKLSSKLIYQSPWIRIFEDKVIRPDGKEGIYAYLDKLQGVYVIAIDAEDNVYMIKEYRYVIDKTIIQLPAGSIEHDSDILETSAKELFEETGIRAGKTEILGLSYVSPGHETTICNVVLATDLDVSEMKINQEDNESILEIFKVPVDQVNEMISKGEIIDSLTLAAFAIYFAKK